MTAKNPKTEMSNFTGGIFCVGTTLAALEWFKPLWALVTEKRMTITLQSTAVENPRDTSVTIHDASVSALVDATQISTGWVTLYALSVAMLAVGIAALIIGYASFILSAGRESEATCKRWNLTMLACGLVAVITTTAGNWGLAWVEPHIVRDLDLARVGYEAAGRFPFILLIAASVLILIGLLSSRTSELEEETAGLV